MRLERSSSIEVDCGRSLCSNATWHVLYRHIPLTPPCPGCTYYCRKDLDTQSQYNPPLLSPLSLQLTFYTLLSIWRVLGLLIEVLAWSAVLRLCRQWIEEIGRLYFRKPQILVKEQSFSPFFHGKNKNKSSFLFGDLRQAGFFIIFPDNGGKKLNTYGKKYARQNWIDWRGDDGFCWYMLQTLVFKKNVMDNGHHIALYTLVANKGL